MAVIVLRSISLTEEEAAVLLVAATALRERPDLLSAEGAVVLAELTDKARDAFEAILEAKAGRS